MALLLSSVKMHCFLLPQMKLNSDKLQGSPKKENEYFILYRKKTVKWQEQKLTDKQGLYRLTEQRSEGLIQIFLNSVQTFY